MEWNETKLKVISKAQFYFEEKFKAHVLTIPKGTFQNGLFKSDLIDEKFYWFLRDGAKKATRLFLEEIYDVEDYVEREGTND